MEASLGRASSTLTSIEVCAGAGGQALGLEQAGFTHVALLEIDRHACQTLRQNRPGWNVIEADIREFSALSYRGVDLLAAGVPCPPFSKAGKQLGPLDDRDLFPEALRLIEECLPTAVLLENVRGLMDPQFDGYRQDITGQLQKMDYLVQPWRLLNASDYGVPQLRPRTICVALRPEAFEQFSWPQPAPSPALTVGQALFADMASRGWPKAHSWQIQANRIAPTLVGGSQKHGGPDLGPTRAKRAWAQLGVDGLMLADEPPGPDYKGMPRLTVQMAAVLQGFPRDWQFAGGKTASYRQVGNAFPPPVAMAVGKAIARSIEQSIHPSTLLETSGVR